MVSGAFSTTMAHKRFFEIVSRVSCSYLSTRPSHSMSLSKNSEGLDPKSKLRICVRLVKCSPYFLVRNAAGGAGTLRDHYCLSLSARSSQLYQLSTLQAKNKPHCWLADSSNQNQSRSKCVSDFCGCSEDLQGCPCCTFPCTLVTCDPTPTMVSCQDSTRLACPL